VRNHAGGEWKEWLVIPGNFWITCELYAIHPIPVYSVALGIACLPHSSGAHYLHIEKNIFMHVI
jgi:hypothetical protein